jgi:hypothetical protein
MCRLDYCLAIQKLFLAVVFLKKGGRLAMFRVRNESHSPISVIEIEDEGSRSACAYLACLAVQSVAALAILAAIQRAFRAVIDALGVFHSVSFTELMLLVGVMCLSQAVYWYRLANIEIPEWHNVVLGHLFGFASRVSFIFGGALFSVFFLRHAPELDSSEGAIPLLSRIAVLLASLFCLYCFTLELERLGDRLQYPQTKISN